MPLLTLAEYVKVNNVPFATPAFECLDVSPLWAKGPRRGSNRLIPGADGQRARKGRVDEWHVDPMKFYIYGDADQDGVPASDGRVQLRANRDYLEQNVFTPNEATEAGTWPLVLYLPDGSHIGAQCQVNSNFQPTPVSPVVLAGILDIIIPAGALAALGS